jgi:16S rRNA (uracil1498-N3)-methyltransferase
MANDPPSIRLFVETPLSAGAEVALAAAQAHYLRAVMRRREGDHVALFNGADGEWRAALGPLGKKAGSARVEALLRPQTGVPDVWLAFAPIKGARLDFVAQKATELGAAALLPVLTERTVVRAVNVERLHANAVEAAEQCGCLSLPAVREPVGLRDLLGGWPTGRGLIFCDEAGAPPALEALAQRRGQGGGWAVLIGPEGGFSDAERRLIRALPRAVPVSLGPRIMRADTAAVAALSLFQATLGDWSVPPRAGAA